MKLKMQIHKIKCINDYTVELPIDKGLYAITGQNGSGKSTIVACASSSFYHIPKKAYFGQTENDAYIQFELGDSKKTIIPKDDSWQSYFEGPQMNIKGFFEGSLIYGNRFKDMSYKKIASLDYIQPDLLVEADEFIRKNLGYILQGDENFYEKIFKYSNKKLFKGTIFFYEKNGRRISQFHMSTGENLLISILNSLLIRNNERYNLSVPGIMLLDEIELALHPASLKRLVQFLEDMSIRYNYAIYFSTHSLELISNISPSNIYFVERYADNTIDIINPCYPAYATRTLYDHNGYDKVILVEDDLAKAIVDRILRDKKLLSSRLVHVMPVGGWSKVLDLANDVVTNNLLGKTTSVSIVLDMDIKDQSDNYKQKNNIANNIPISYLPIESLEKYLKKHLVIKVNHDLYNLLDSYIFKMKSLTSIIDEYKKSYNLAEDKNGKKLWNLIDTELRERRLDRSELVKMIVEHLFENNDANIDKLTEFLKKQMES